MLFLPFQFLLPDSGQSIVIALNQPIANTSVFDKCFRDSNLNICCDGGLNRIHELPGEYVPDFICGDFDSIEI